MTNLELVLNMLAEATTAEISKEKEPKNFLESKKIANQGGTIAGNTRKEIEAQTGKKIVTSVNAKEIFEAKKESKQLNPKKKLSLFFLRLFSVLHRHNANTHNFSHTFKHRFPHDIKKRSLRSTLVGNVGKPSLFVWNIIILN